MWGFASRRLVTWIAAATIAGPACAGQLEDAAAAYDKQDYVRAEKLWHELAEKGNAHAQNRLGTMYYLGRGVARDYAVAAKWFRLAAEQGYANAQANLAAAYAEGNGVKRDPAQSVKWYKRAADQGNALAQNNLGVRYAKGDGVSEDVVKAYMWYTLSAAQGNEAAAKNREQVASRMTPAQVKDGKRLASQWKPRRK